MDLKEAIEICRFCDAGGNIENTRDISEAECVISDAYLAQHPPDDDEPITREWWHSEVSQGDEAEILNNVGVWLIPKNQVGIFVGDSYTRLDHIKTRGDVRRLVKLLGGE